VERNLGNLVCYKGNFDFLSMFFKYKRKFISLSGNIHSLCRLSMDNLCESQGAANKKIISTIVQVVQM